jgi:integrase
MIRSPVRGRQKDPRSPDVLLPAVPIRHDRLQASTIGGGHLDLDPLAHGATLPRLPCQLESSVRSCPLGDLRPHDLRHNFTSMLQAHGVSDSIIMSITGHRTHVMLHRYSHSNDQMRLAAVEALPDPTPSKDETNLVPLRKA